MKNGRREEDEEEVEERAGSPQLEADLAFELVLQVESKPKVVVEEPKKTKVIFMLLLIGLQLAMD